VFPFHGHLLEKRRSYSRKCFCALGLELGLRIDLAEIRFRASILQLLLVVTDLFFLFWLYGPVKVK